MGWFHIVNCTAHARNWVGLGYAQLQFRHGGWRRFRAVYDWAARSEGRHLEVSSSPLAEETVLFPHAGLLGQLSECEDVEEMSRLADQALQQLQLHSGSSPPANQSWKRYSSQLHGCGVSLWNRAVTLKSASTLSLSLNAKRELTEL